MPQITFVDHRGERVRLGAEIGRGGEATVYSVQGHPGLVAKIYHQLPGREKIEKLSKMVELQNERLLAISAWPTGTLFIPDGGTLIGFLMKNMRAFKDIHLLYNPKSRTREFSQKANWQFLVHTAANVARAFIAIHEHGHVIGDVNQSNVRVSPETAIVSMVDCDSFQISSDGKLYPCEVGVPLFTPPELQETEFRDVVRTPSHDNFGLAILIFHLLFMGRHPFAGKFLGLGEMPIEKAIAEQRFAFDPDVQRTQMLPPPACITLAHLPPEIGELFTKAFHPDAALHGRPDGRKWLSALDALNARLIICSKNKAHLFFHALSSCPWCSIESSGVLLFVDHTIVPTASGFSLEVTWSAILAVPPPGPGNMPSLLTFFSDVEPSPRAKAAARKRHYKIAGIVLFLLVSVATILVSDYGFLLLYLGAALIGVLRGLLNNDPPANFVQAARAAEARLRGLQRAWQRDASGQTFDAKLEDLRTLSDEYRRLPESRKAMVRELEKSLYVTQMRNYLQQFDIATADIPQIKEGRKAMLSAYGIDDAADITFHALESVPGFGSFLVMQLITWRQGLEAKFQFDPRRGIDPADVQRVDHSIAKRRAEIETLLRKGPSELRNLQRHIVAARGRLQGELETALRDVAQAQADERAA
jgi:DNA-binding helix-hairpin-helix protein with protein kinase domain